MDSGGSELVGWGTRRSGSGGGVDTRGISIGWREEGGMREEGRRDGSSESGSDVDDRSGGVIQKITLMKMFL